VNTTSEVWKPIKGYLGLYEISNMGNVRSLDKQVGCRGGTTRCLKGKLLVGGTYPNGYKFVGLTNKNNKRRNHLLHRLVAAAFIGNPKRLPIVLHRDDNPANNKAINLRWGTQQQNIDDMISKERHAFGSKIGNSVLSERQVRAIKLAMTKGVTNRALAQKYNVHEMSISRIKRGKVWNHVK
jgi:hypothetical protein